MAKKLNYQNILNYINGDQGNGCTLITSEEEYLKGVKKLEIKCKCGNYYKVEWGNFKNSKKQCQKCSILSGSLKHRLSIDDLEKYIKILNNGTKLISETYENNLTKLKFKCECGNYFNCTWGNFTNGQNKCTDCLKGNYYWTMNKVQDFMNTKDNNGCLLLSTEFKNSYNEKLEFKCKCGEIFYKTWTTFIKGQNKCNKCAVKERTNKRKMDIKYIKDFMKDYDCELISDNYVNNRTKLKIRCKCGTIFEASWNEFKDSNKRQCNECGWSLKSGENNGNWKGGVTPENMKIRSSRQYAKWRNDVYKRDNYTCQCCGDSKGGNLVAHHINNFSNNEELRFEIDNGITLCNNCHNPSMYGSFHYVYGSKNNSQEQLEEYIKRYKNGEFDELKNKNLQVVL